MRQREGAYGSDTEQVQGGREEGEGGGDTGRVRGDDGVSQEGGHTAVGEGYRASGEAVGKAVFAGPPWARTAGGYRWRHSWDVGRRALEEDAAKKGKARHESREEQAAVGRRPGGQSCSH